MTHRSLVLPVGVYAGKVHVIEHDVEGLIDAHGLSQVLDSMSTVCFEKAEHLRVNWQDQAAANA